MRMATSLLLYTQGLIGLALALYVARRESNNKRENAMLTLNMLTVFIWNISYLVMFQSHDDQVNLRYASRNIGMLASIIAVVLCHSVLMQGLNLSKRLARLIMQIELILGLLVYPMVIARESITFKKVSFGWGYAVNDYPWRVYYTIYCVAVIVAMLLMSVEAVFRGKTRQARPSAGTAFCTAAS